jgi:hypothetical protein
MDNTLVTNLVITNNTLDTNSITTKIANTNCIVCGKGFEMPRMGKLYCSSKCKQFGYNHKNEIAQALANRQQGISPRQMTFYIDDYNIYYRKNKMLKRYKELEKKQKEWDSADQNIAYRQKLNLPISDFTLGEYASKKLSENEESDLYDNEMALDERILDLNPRELSLEQWSFIKSLYPSLDELAFFEIVTSLSKQFFEQLNLRMDSNSGNKDFIVIRNKFINHCNMIATGVIQFAKKEED